MSSKEKGLREALKDMFKRNKGNSGNLSTRGDSLCLNEELLKDLSKESPIASRVKILKEYSSRVKESKLENTALEKLWNAIEDLFGPDHATETRHVAFAFLQSLLRGQYDKLKLMRAHFFRFIKHHDHPEDVGQRLDSLNILTCNGKNILYFEEEVGPFLLQWLPDISKAGKIEEYLSMVDNVVKFNAAYLDDEVISGFIQHMCILCCSTGNSKTVVESCLQIMSTIVAYSNMPPESLPKFIGTLCRTVNVEDYCMLSWKIMKNLLGTHMGHSTLYTMCRILQEPALSSDSDLLRGAVFYIHMALWGSIPVTNLHCPPSSVLPSFLHAIKCNQASVAFEVVLGLQHLVHRHGQELQNPAWSVLLQIILHIIHHFDLSSNQPPNKEIKVCLRETLNNIENLMEIGSYNGSVEQFFRIIEECSADQPESSILRLIMYYSQSIVPTEHLWLTNLYNLLHKYFKPEIRTNIRLKVLDILANVIKLNRRQYEDELIERIVLPHTVNVVNCNDVIVRSSVANLLIDLALECESKKCVELLDILERLLLRPFDSHMQDIPPNTEIEHYDIQCLVEGLIKVFIYKIHKLPSIQAIKIYKMLVTFLECHYKQPKVFENCPVIRRMIFDCFLKMRADSLYHLGYDNGEKIEYSHYLCVVYHNPDRGSLGSPVPQSPAPTQNLPVSVTHVSLRRAFKVFLSCLKFEKDWEVLSLVLKEMTKGLQNKSLILSKQGNNELDLLVDVLCAMITDKSYNLPESLNMKVSKPNFHALVILVLVNLASYHNYLDQSHQQKMIRCLMKCTNSIGPKSSKHCIAALTICTLEMREAMVKLLPEVLLNLSKISATVHIAIPVLEFISTLAQLPMVYSSFVADQYMAVFAISLPYTNPFRYDHYTVSLAHHVIAVWFLKCRLPFRKDFVKFITNGLQTNVLIPFEETKTTIFNQNLSELNQDSSDRKRSSSLTEQGSRRRTANVSAVRMDKAVLKKSSPEKSLMTFYEELTETCIDLMARYAFSPCSALPRRLPVAEFLLNGGQSMCWLIGNKLFTVTTSGCSQKILKNGLCDKCWTLCSNQNESRKKTGRSGSNETDDLDWASRQNSNEKSNNTSVSSPSEDLRKIGDKLDMVSSKLQQIASSVKQEKEMCACWCSGWAEIYVRRPTGDMSWVMRIQNQISFTHSIYDFPLNELSTLFMPSLYPETSPSLRPPLRRQFSEDQVNQDEDKGSLAAMGSNSSLPGREIQKSSSSSILEKNTSNVNLNLARERARERKNSGSMERLSSLEPNLMQKRDRVHTISVMSPVTRKPRSETFRSHTKSKEVPKSGINPSFVFLQLYHQASFGSKSERPILVENNDIALRAVKVLDSIAPYETHKIGVVYVREGQTNSEVEIYKNRFGSLRYVEFLQQLGTLVKLEDVDPQVFFLGGLDQHGNDGKFAYIWQDDVIRVMFHVATMMPNKESDPFCNNKKMHIGNNYVTIVYNDSKEDFNISTIKGQFTFVCIVIHPLDHGINKVVVKVKEELSNLVPVSEPKLVSDQNVAILARQLALHANLASLVARSLKNHSSDPYASNWLERLRKIKNIRNKVMQDRKNEENIQQAEEGKGNKQMEDFTDYT
ncbi:TSC complex subunit tuberin isoform X2 [Leptinotarsa decemlineata]|uniref:TSC complex subunit tuberin isoform X2 n=1 Tax=Leptinotarsa decemlineata TaxID=7539 RepID=UPI003D30D537